MANMRTTIEPKSDQLNADFLIGGKSITIKVTCVDICTGDQPVSIHYEGENGRPYKPCKSMRRVLVHVWGADESAYVGRSMTLYCDEKVQFGGLAVGGIRISHMSHIDKDVPMALTVTRGTRKLYTVKPLAVQEIGPAKITRDQQKEIVAAMGADVKPADLLTHFKVKSSAEIQADQFDEVMAWIRDMKQAQPGPSC